MVALIGWFGWMDVLVLSALLLLCFALLWYVLINGLVWVILLLVGEVCAF